MFRVYGVYSVELFLFIIPGCLISGIYLVCRDPKGSRAGTWVISGGILVP